MRCEKPCSGSELNAAAENYFAKPCAKNKALVLESAKGLILKLARIYGGCCCIDDLYQTGCEGLLKALDSYDASKGANFATHAFYCIMGAIRHYVRKEKLYYFPGCIEKLQRKALKFIEESFEQSGEIPDTEYIAERLNILAEGFDEVMKSGLVSFDEINIDAIHSKQYESFQLPIEDKLLLESAIKKLDELQRKVIKLLFFRGLTQNEAAKQLGLTQRQVSRIKEKSIEIMKGIALPNGKGK